jgi:hypothetical protein
MLNRSKKQNGHTMLKRLCLTLLISLWTLPALALEDEAVLSTYKTFVAHFRAAETAQQLQPLLAEGSPLYDALSTADADSALGQYQQMLASFQQQELAVEVENDTAHVIARGRAPVDNPQLLKFIRVAFATFQVSLQRQGDEWKVANTSYKVRYNQ